MCLQVFCFLKQLCRVSSLIDVYLLQAHLTIWIICMFLLEFRTDIQVLKSCYLSSQPVCLFSLCHTGAVSKMLSGISEFFINRFARISLMVK